jgi:hypothetical protein
MTSWNDLRQGSCKVNTLFQIIPEKKDLGEMKKKLLTEVADYTKTAVRAPLLDGRK